MSNTIKFQFFNPVEAFQKGLHYDNAFITNANSGARKANVLYVREAKDVLSKGCPFYHEKEVLDNIFNLINDAFFVRGEESIDIRIPCRVLCDWIMKGIVVKPAFQRNSDIKTNIEKSNIVGSLISGDTESLGHIIFVLKPGKDYTNIEIFEVEDGQQRSMTFVEFLYDITSRKRLSTYSTPTNFRLSGTGTCLDNHTYTDIITACPKIKENIDNTMIKVTIRHPSRHPDSPHLFNVSNGKQTRISPAETVNAEFYQNEFFNGTNDVCNKKDVVSKIISRLFGGSNDNKRFATTINMVAAVAFSDFCTAEDTSMFASPAYKSTSANVAKQYLKDMNTEETLEKIAMVRKVINKMVKLDMPVNFCHSINLNKCPDGAPILCENGAKGYPKNYEPFYRNGSKCVSISCLVFAAYCYMINNKFTDKEMIEALIPMEYFIAHKFDTKHTTLGKSFFMHINEFISDINNYFKK